MLFIFIRGVDVTIVSLANGIFMLWIVFWGFWGVNVKILFTFTVPLCVEASLVCCES